MHVVLHAWAALGRGGGGGGGCPGILVYLSRDRPSLGWQVCPRNVCLGRVALCAICTGLASLSYLHNNVIAHSTVTN